MATPASDNPLRSLDRLVGTWTIDGPGLSGTVRYEWMEGGGFLVQHVDLVHDGQANRGVEYIGLDKDSGTLRSHFFSGSGEILEYTYRLDDATLTIWYGGTDSPAKYVGTFDTTSNRCTGAWEWPGGGYQSTMTRIED